MHVKHVNFAKGFRGGERQTLNLVEGLAAEGISQTLVCHPDSELRKRAEQIGVATRLVRQPMCGHMAPSRADIVHVHEARGAYWAAIEHLLRGTEYLITRRIPNPVSGNVVNRYVYQRAIELVGVSRDVSARLREQTGHDVATVLDSCTVHAGDPLRVAEIKAQLGGGPIIGHVGALQDHHKGQSILIAAFQQLLQAYPDARLVLLGEGPDKERFVRQAAGDARIVFAGFQQDVGSWLMAMDVFAFPSREEGLGSSVLDAMLLGVPVVSSTVGGLPELIGDDARGLSVQGGDPVLWAQTLRRMLEDRDLRERLRQAAQQFAQQHDIAAMTRQYLHIYNAILGLRS
jgi:glycosyltransferase involved in cell wall biosynthesis